MPEIKCPWMMCVHNKSKERNSSGKCNFVGEVELNVPDVRKFIETPPGELIDAELIECKNYEKSLEKQNKFKEE
jgi:hypothetical protein